MRFKDKKIHAKKENMNKINNVLNKCGCSFVRFEQDDNGYNRYTVFADKMYNQTFSIETKKIGFDNVMALITEKQEA